jgi:hypothetical protein
MKQLPRMVEQLPRSDGRPPANPTGFPSPSQEKKESFLPQKEWQYTYQNIFLSGSCRSWALIINSFKSKSGNCVAKSAGVICDMLEVMPKETRNFQQMAILIKRRKMSPPEVVDSLNFVSQNSGYWDSRSAL